MKKMFKHQYLQMFGIEFNSSNSDFTHLKLWVAVMGDNVIISFSALRGEYTLAIAKVSA